ALFRTKPGRFLLAGLLAPGYKYATEARRSGRSIPRRGVLSHPGAASPGSPSHMASKTAPATKTKKTSKPHSAPSSSVREAIEATEGLLRLAPTWVPRSFLMPGRRIKLAPEDVYAYGAHRGGIDERWFASTTPAANENRVE